MELVHRGILTGLGTDGYTHDMTESYKVANVLHKHHLCDPNAAWGEVPQMLFDGNVKIAERYFPQKLGVLKEGAAADVIVVDYDPLTPMNGAAYSTPSSLLWIPNEYRLAISSKEAAYTGASFLNTITSVNRFSMSCTMCVDKTTI